MFDINPFGDYNIRMRALIYGGGAVGLGLASCLLKSHARVDIIARENTVEALHKNGLIRTGIFGRYYASPSAFGSYISLGQAPNKAYDYILGCTKSFDSYRAAKDLAGHRSVFGPDTKIVLFQNGWGNAEAFTCFFDKQVVYNARVITGFQRSGPNEVTVTVHADSIHIGSLFSADVSNVTDLSESIDRGDIPCRITGEIGKDIWAKMLYNCALNPLGAILGVPYGKLAENEYTQSIMNGICREIFDVMTTSGHKTHWQTAKDFLEVFYKKLVPDTAEHKSSTLQDIVAKKPTEIDALNGAVISLAGKYSIAVPYNQIVYDMVKFIETKGVN